MKDKRILFISKGENSASTRYRALAYFDSLRSKGWKPLHITAHAILPRVKLLGIAKQAEVVVILRKTFSLPFLYLLRLCSKNLVFDLDDAVFCRSDGEPSKSRQMSFEKVTSICEQVWAGNLYLADMAGQYNKAVKILPTSLDYHKYLIEVEKNADYFDLVWIGSRSTQKYLKECLPVLESMAENIPNLRLKIVADFDLPTKRLKTVAVPWSDEVEAEALASAHVGIAPMPDDPWTKGKCGLKVLQYMAAGLPVVSSPAGVNREIVQQSKTGFLAENPDDWRQSINKLFSEPDLRDTMGKAGQERVIEHFSVDKTFRKMSMALNALVQGGNQVE
ncbi:MAG: glycosyltransferase family 4 protein [Proteobacteria bacterium]|nr:glycosyltransferase family 4 protein [Pseudomonadota bacterium]MCG2757159.1 glycosyltransferase family 4 protein [Desulfobacteraceae bacterium]